MSKQRTSISISEKALEAGKERWAELGYASFSEYVEFLILEDKQRRGNHVVTRGGGVAKYEIKEEEPRLESCLRKGRLSG